MGVRAVWQGVLVLLAAHTHPAHSAFTKCRMPEDWRGMWFHSGVTDPVLVDQNAISFKGECVQSDKDRFLLRDTFHNCYRCLFIHQQHFNVLQYKETYCDQSDSLEVVCSLLTGDAQLHSMFRVNAKAQPCPFPHSYTFTYNRGHAECNYPLSTVDRCTDDSRMLFKFQACPDIPGTESSKEELMCLATWKEGSNRYLVGKADHFLATSDEDRYRCFVYKNWNDEMGSGVRMAQSGDATCNGLFSVTGGSMTLKLKKVDTSRSGCRFPSWLAGPHWHSLDGHVALHVTRRNATLHMGYPRVHRGPVTHSCLEVHQSSEKSATYVTHVIRGCESGYQCVHLLERDTGVMELLMGRSAQMDSLACDEQYFDPTSTNFTTFVSSAVEKRECPLVGRYEVVGGRERITGASIDDAGAWSDATGAMAGGRGGGGAPGEPEGGVGAVEEVGRSQEEEECRRRPFTTLDVGCSTIDTLVIGNTCSSSEYSCIGWWETEGRQFVVVTPKSRSSKGVRRLCLMLDQRGPEGGLLSLASSALSCGRNLTQGFLGHTLLNATIIDKGGCGTNESFSGTSRLAPSPLLSTSLLLLLPLLVLLAPSSSSSPLLPVRC